MELGNEGLVEANLTIPQSTSLGFDLVVVDDAGDPVDLTGSDIHMRFQYHGKKIDIDRVMDHCCSYVGGAIKVFVPGTETATMPVGTFNWDIIVDTALGESVRICYGDVRIIDTYAKDEV